MKIVRHCNLVTVFFYIGIVFVLILQYGCSGVTHTNSIQTTPFMQNTPTMSSETTEEQWQLMENPKTGKMEMMLVKKVHTTVSTSTSFMSGPETHITEDEGEYKDSNWDINDTLITISVIVIAVALVVKTSN